MADIAFGKNLADIMSGQSVLDLLIPGQSPGIKERLVDLYNKPEILFFGPDGAHIRIHFVVFWCSWDPSQRERPI